MTQIRAITLLLIAALLLILGNRKVWIKAIDEINAKRNMNNDGIANLRNTRFERQRLNVDSLSHTISNPHLYIQTIRLGEMSFPTTTQQTAIIEDENQPERASTSR